MKTTVHNNCKNNVTTSESIGLSSVAVHHTARATRAATRHPSAVVEGLRLAAEAVALASRLLGHGLVASGVWE